MEWTTLARKKQRLLVKGGINWGTSACSEQWSARKNTEANENGCYSGEQLNSSNNLSKMLVWKTGSNFLLCQENHSEALLCQQSQKTFASRTEPTKPDAKCYSQKRNLSSKRCQQKLSEAVTASEFQSLRQLSSSDLYHGRIAIYSLIQKLYLQELDSIVSQSSSSITEVKGNNNSDNAYCHKALGKVGEVELGQVEFCKIKVKKGAKVRYVSLVVEVGKVGKVE